MSKGNQSCTDNNKETENKIKENNTENNLEITENNINLGGQVSFDCDIKNVSPKSNTNEDDNIYDDNGNITKKKKQNFRIKAKRGKNTFVYFSFIIQNITSSRFIDISLCLIYFLVIIFGTFILL